MQFVAGAAVNLLTADRSQPRWSFGAWYCSHVQDRQSKVREYCPFLDTEIRHEL